MLRGYKKKELNDFNIVLTPPSYLREMEEFDLIEQTARAANEMVDFGFSKITTAEKLFKVNRDEWVKEYQQRQKEEMGEDPYAEPVNPNASQNPYADDGDPVFANPNAGGEGDDSDYYQSSDEILRSDDQKDEKKPVKEIRDNAYLKFLAEGELNLLEDFKEELEEEIDSTVYKESKAKLTESYELTKDKPET
jgi:hypothetical protein